MLFCVETIIRDLQSRINATGRAVQNKKRQMTSIIRSTSGHQAPITICRTSEMQMGLSFSHISKIHPATFRSMIRRGNDSIRQENLEECKHATVFGWIIFR